MTVTYIRGLADTNFTTLMKVVFRWRGSVWKCVMDDMIIWLTFYCIISLFYRLVLFGTVQGNMFEEGVKVVDHYLKTYGSSMNFVAAFYITYINNRWWWTFLEIPCPDNLFMYISALMKSNGKIARKKERQLRLTIGRYWNLAFVLLFRDICISTKKRFPNLERLIPKLATSEEVALFHQANDLSKGFQQTCLYGLPLDWIERLIKQAGDDKNFLKSHMVIMHKEVVKIRSKMYNLLAQDFITAIPISLTQCAMAAPVIYFSMCLIGKQYLVYHHIENNSTKQIPKEAYADFVIPYYTLYEFVIYVGWIKTALACLNPFGNNDDDFEVDFVIDRNIRFGEVFLDQIFDMAPLIKDFPVIKLPQAYDPMRERRFEPLVGSMSGPIEQRRPIMEDSGGVLAQMNFIEKTLQSLQLKKPTSAQKKPTSAQKKQEEFGPPAGSLAAAAAAAAAQRKQQALKLQKQQQEMNVKANPVVEAPTPLKTPPIVDGVVELPPPPKKDVEPPFVNPYVFDDSALVSGDISSVAGTQKTDPPSDDKRKTDFDFLMNIASHF